MKMIDQFDDKNIVLLNEILKCYEKKDSQRLKMIMNDS